MEIPQDTREGLNTRDSFHPAPFRSVRRTPQQIVKLQSDGQTPLISQALNIFVLDINLVHWIENKIIL